MIQKKSIHRCETITLVGAAFCSVAFFTKLTILWVIGIGILLAAVILFVKVFRCPHCGKFLNRNPGTHGEKRCNHCHKKIYFKE